MLPILIGDTMNKKVIPFEVQLKQNNNFIVQGINQNDAGVIFDIKIMNGLVGFDFSGYSIVTLKITKPDKTMTIDSTGGSFVDIVDAENGRLKINIPTSCTAQNGMHYCRVGFASEDNTLFDAMMFNYFVGEDQNAKNEEIMGTNEYPILGNLIAEVANAITAERQRLSSEQERITAENDRKENSATLIALFVEAVGFLEEKILGLQSMLDELNQALADGGSVDISQISALATKTYVNNYTKNLDFLGNNHDSRLQIYRATANNIPALSEGELAYATNTNNLYIGGTNGNVLLTQPCYTVGNTAPTDTTRLWIDTSGATPLIKYYNGSTWVACNNAVFA